jgi:hypothetical protein
MRNGEREDYRDNRPIAMRISQRIADGTETVFSCLADTEQFFVAS